MDLTHDAGINLVNSLVSWAQDRSFPKDLPEVTSQDYCHSSKWSMLCVLICESKLSVLKRKLKYAPYGFTSRYVPGIKLEDLFPFLPSFLCCCSNDV
ncbi:uncharacterized protein [Aegilops tauschii subsp. strangulata]|uniref:uncharacterized protein isoform X2 n=1 Tax=Aegilops tauschii subsp. strangulata TaxID=200361 RepID=UPI003CC8A0ED